MIGFRPDRQGSEPEWRPWESYPPFKPMAFRSVPGVVRMHLAGGSNAPPFLGERTDVTQITGLLHNCQKAFIPQHTSGFTWIIRVAIRDCGDSHPT